MPVLFPNGIDTSKIGAYVGGAIHSLIASVFKAVGWASKSLLGGVVGAALILGGQHGCLPIPVPPPPPGPVVPTDPMTTAFQNAYNADTDATKAASIKKLATLWGLAATSVANPSASDTTKTYSAFIAATHSVADTTIGVGSLPKLRRAIADAVDADVKAIFGSNADFDLTPDNRAKLSVEFQKVATALGGVK